MPLILVPTPLGNLRDVTLRALDVLREAELIVAEDTRVARKLLSALGIRGREIWSYREQNAAAVTGAILERARAGQVAVTTDAGMPGISDPGTELVAAAHAANIAVEVLPGPSAAFAVALLAGFGLRRFVFEGFVHPKAGPRRRQFEEALRANATTIWYESPARIEATLRDLAAVAPDARVFLVRELSKRHEQQLHGTPAEIAEGLEQPVRGEIAFAIAPYASAAVADAASDAEIDALLARGERVGDVARALSRQGRGDRQELYARASRRKRAESPESR
jgi:16S rRNA (cytidine1402-2'-O)-methyltransferase